MNHGETKGIKPANHLPFLSAYQAMGFSGCLVTKSLCQHIWKVQSTSRWESMELMVIPQKIPGSSHAKQLFRIAGRAANAQEIHHLKQNFTSKATVFLNNIVGFQTAPKNPSHSYMSVF